MIYLGQDVSVLNEPSLLLSLEFSAHTVRIIARPTTIICLRSKSNKTNPKKQRHCFRLSWWWYILCDRIRNKVPLQKFSRLFFPLQYKDLTTVPTKSRPASTCFWESTANTTISSWDSKVHEKSGLSCSLEYCESGLIN